MEHLFHLFLLPVICKQLFLLQSLLWQTHDDDSNCFLQLPVNGYSLNWSVFLIMQTNLWKGICFGLTSVEGFALTGNVGHFSRVQTLLHSLTWFIKVKVQLPVCRASRSHVRDHKGACLMPILLCPSCSKNKPRFRFKIHSQRALLVIIIIKRYGINSLTIWKNTKSQNSFCFN